MDCGYHGLHTIVYVCVFSAKGSGGRMATIQKVTGRLAALGAMTHSRAGGESSVIYEYLRIETEGGNEQYFERVIVPSYLDSVLSFGAKGDFFVLTVPFPKMFGSSPVHIVFATSCEGKPRQAIPQAARCVTSGNGGLALKLVLFGLIMMPAFGFGLVFWIWALRMMLVKVPMTDMQRLANGN